MRLKTLLGVASALALLVACTTEPAATDGSPSQDSSAAKRASGEDAAQWVAGVNAEASELFHELSQLSWIRSTYINHDTNALASKARERSLEFNSRIVEESKRFDAAEVDMATARAIKLVKLGTSMPAPNDADKRSELAKITVAMDTTYGTGKYCPSGPNSCKVLGELEEVLAESRDYGTLLDIWTGWRTVSKPMRPQYQRFVELVNEGAAELGFADAGAMWRSGYDMSAEDFEADAERLWNQVKPLYEQVHCHVRAVLADTYGAERVRAGEPIPAHLLGNMWSQSWSNIYDLMEPFEGVSDLDVTAALVDQEYDADRMVRLAEDFFTSLDLPSLPDTFFERSLLTKPRDREVQCHASAWPIDGKEDVRIKMCIEPKEEHLTTIYHELGHIYYFLVYKNQPPLFQGGAHDGFHEAIGDTIVLSMTPQYLKSIGLVEDVQRDNQAVINQQMKQALDKIAFLPFGKMVDQWRWDVFSGKLPPEKYNEGWWQLRTKYQGIAPPVARSEEDFDPGAKYHIPANTPYTRYFLSFILQFQFHRALCDVAGHEGPLHECSIYGSKEAGQRFAAMMEMGQSQPWQDALEKLTGTRDMDATAIIDYFAPLMGWLEAQNQGRECGWSESI